MKKLILGLSDFQWSWWGFFAGAIFAGCVIVII